jgi:tRNA threonylcarbamoyladenosine biosynthesis protein TsaE
MNATAANAEEMNHVGALFARECQPGTIFALVGDLGAGKTHWTQGFVRELGSQAAITSPTFGLLHEYTDGPIPVFHLDFYRMKTAEEAIALGWDELLDQPAIIITEWADRFPELFPAHTRWLQFSIQWDLSRTIREKIHLV